MLIMCAIPWTSSRSRGRLTRAGDRERSIRPHLPCELPSSASELGRLDLQLRLWAGEYGEASLRRGARPVPLLHCYLHHGGAPGLHRRCCGEASASVPRPSDTSNPLPWTLHTYSRPSRKCISVQRGLQIVLDYPRERYPSLGVVSRGTTSRREVGPSPGPGLRRRCGAKEAVSAFSSCGLAA